MASQVTTADSVGSKFCFSSHLNLEDMYIKLMYNLLQQYITSLALSHPHLHSRAMQEKFAAERNWEQYHTPRNLLLAMVNTD